MDEYVREFVRESEEGITELNNALLTLEQNPDDDDAMDLIFRTAHTLKGNAGAMGFDRAEALAHALEDLLDAVRRGEIEVSAQLMDRIFDAVDQLEAMIEEIPEHGSPQTEPEETIEMLREELEAAAAISIPTDAEIDELLAAADEPADDRHNRFHVRLNVAEEREQHGMLVVEALEDAFDLLGTSPPEAEISEGEYGGNFDAVFASAVGEESISAALDPVDAVEDALIEEVTDREVSPSTDDAGEATDVDTDDGQDPEEMEVDDLLNEFSEYDDLDEMVEQVDDVEGFDDLGDAGSFDDIEVGDIDPVDEDPADMEEAGDDAVEASTELADDDEVEDASDTFKELQQEVDPVGFDELQAELDELEFEELDDDEVGFDELLEEDELGGDDPFAAGEFTEDDPFGAGDEGDEIGVDELLDEAEEADPADPDVEAGEGDQDVTTPDEPDVESDEPDVESDEPDVESDEPTTATAVKADDDETEAADTTGSTEQTSEADDLDFPAGNDELFGDDTIDDVPEEEAPGALDLDDAEIQDVDDADESPELDLEDPFAGSESIDEPDADTATAEDGDSLDDTDDVQDDSAISEAGAFSDIDFGDPADPEAEPGELDAGGFGSADELDLSMDLEAADDESVSPEENQSSGDADSTLEAEPAGTPEDIDPDSTPEDIDPDSTLEADPDSTLEADPDSTLEDTDPSEALQESDPGTTAGDGTADDEPSDEAVEASVESVNLDSGTEPPDVGYERPSAAAGTDVDSETIQSVRVDTEQVDQLMSLVEGLVSTRARLRRAVEADEPRRVIDNEVDELDALTSELQDTVMDVRLVPLRNVVNKLPRLVRDISRDQDKQVTLDMEGEDVEVDRSILDEIGDPLMHIVRNAIDHGIEPPEEREEAGKDPSGSIELRAHRERDTVVIEVEDDGRGIDVDDLGDAAVAEGIVEREDLVTMDDEEIYELVFHPGFSTSEEVTDVSGRGVGMDVVARTINDLDGSVDIESEPGDGTTVRIEVPISLAIADVLFVESGGEEYGIPTRVVSEIGPSGAVELEDGQEVVRRGETSYPLIRLDEALETPERGQNGDGMLVQVRDDVRPVAVHCDRVRGQQEVVVKPFEGFIGDIPGLSGATVLGEGDVVNILDIETL
ncbi:ATP-binding protein [Natranaeroarchaeum aerophilus]|uniref:Chemotaxis protein CheA n=1 Tax=Natranaeroarchaeum aerophilus TaxID=2917711 RepID=A0AAE3K6D5_9EURY|nr:ATP-binding protein [Natranaeroarchaeum aerophilus]MCL9815127.1 ATP-binding protein [Natranaeroarchaeum aerophilus]